MNVTKLPFLFFPPFFNHYLSHFCFFIIIKYGCDLGEYCFSLGLEWELNYLIRVIIARPVQKPKPNKISKIFVVAHTPKTNLSYTKTVI